MIKLYPFLGLLLFGLIMFIRPAQATVRLPAIIGSHMVLQQNSTVRLWGWCDPDERVTVKVGWDTTTYVTIGKNTAYWQVQLKTPAGGGPYQVRIAGQNTLVLDDVLLGEVWVCAGQSNMEWSGARGIRQAAEAAPQATNTAIHFFYVPKTTAATPQNDTQARWVVCSPETMLPFSAVGYFFGQKLQQTLRVPVGLINANWEGTAAEVWTPAELVLANPVLRDAASKVPTNPTKWPFDMGVGYNAMIHPLTPFTIAGVIWYQGETNANVRLPETYVVLFETMIDSWRKAWQQDFPFYYVQIAPFSMYNQPFNGALLREAQTRVATHPHTGMVVIHDLVEKVSEIHPQNKKDVALRLANYALADTYKQPGIAYKSPLYQRMTPEKGAIRLFFSEANTGLESRSGPPREFMVAGADRVFHPATARIDGQTIVVSSTQVSQPVAVRFGFDNASTPNVFSKDGLPLNLFRTDSWPVD